MDQQANFTKTTLRSKVLPIVGSGWLNTGLNIEQLVDRLAVSVPSVYTMDSVSLWPDLQPTSGHLLRIGLLE